VKINGLNRSLQAVGTVTAGSDVKCSYTCSESLRALWSWVSSLARLFSLVRNMAKFLQRGVVSTSPNSQAGGPRLLGYPRLFIQNIRSYPPYLQTVPPSATWGSAVPWWQRATYHRKKSKIIQTTIDKALKPLILNAPKQVDHSCMCDAVFRRVRKIAKSDYKLRHVRLSVLCPHAQLGSRWTNFDETWYLNFFSKICWQNSSLMKIRQE
jgi:hypothetical protein